MEEKILEKLCVEILKELERTNKSYTVFADLCGISRNLMGSIVNRKKTDIKLSTIVKICENSSISLIDIFLFDEEMETEMFLKYLNKFYLTDGKEKISLNLK